MQFSCFSQKSKKSIDDLQKFLKIIGDENRLKILCLLKGGELCVCDIWQALQIPQNLASHHLKTLKDLKLVSSEKKGLKVTYKLNNKEIAKYNDILNHFLS